MSPTTATKLYPTIRLTPFTLQELARMVTRGELIAFAVTVTMHDVVWC